MQGRNDTTARAAPVPVRPVLVRPVASTQSLTVHASVNGHAQANVTTAQHAAARTLQASSTGHT
jgi:hypothetical protein